LNEVDPCTRAWLHFLRVEAEKNESRAFKVWNGGITIPDVWEASAVQCERSAREYIEAQLRANAENREKGFRAAEGLVSGSAKKENTEGSPLRDGLDLSALQDAARRTLAGSFRAYATKIHATEWASYDDGETAEYVKCSVGGTRFRSR
jgi:hypothetical protein